MRPAGAKILYCAEAAHENSISVQANFAQQS
jgi:hypothetical protein